MPEHAIILNLALDHHDIETTASMFRRLSANTPGTKLINADDAALTAKLPKAGRTFSLDAPSNYRATEIALEDFGSRFRLGNLHFSIAIPGKHNVSNAVAALAMLSELGAGLQDAATHLPDFNGISRRFEIIRNDNHLVIDDYAHNPHKIAALMTTVSRIRKKICYVFQPHGFGPVRLMKDEYIEVFREGLRNSDMLVLLPIYYAGGNVAMDVSSEDISGPVNKGGGHAITIEKREELFDIVQKYEACVVFGARDYTLNNLAYTLAESFRSA
jgi:UDP-N-acetylmuramate--alanine ligase